MRLFIAIRLNEKSIRRVKTVQDTFRNYAVRGNYTPPENMHITLAFIGEFGDPESVLEAMEQVTFKLFTITMDRIGCFDDLWWTGFAESKELETLAGRLRHALAEAGIPFDKKRFKAHVTLLRKATYCGIRPALETIEPVKMRVDRISLMQSTRGKNGMIYTELGAVEA